MQFYWVIRFNGCLNEERNMICNLIVIELNTNSEIPYLFSHDLYYYLRQKRGETKELGPKNGPGTAGWLEVKYLISPESCSDVKVIKIDSFDISKVYNIIKPHLKKAIDEKIKIKGKGE
jgi:hypothetical protein